MQKKAGLENAVTIRRRAETITTPGVLMTQDGYRETTTTGQRQWQPRPRVRLAAATKDIATGQMAEKRGGLEDLWCT